VKGEWGKEDMEKKGGEGKKRERRGGPWKRGDP